MLDPVTGRREFINAVCAVERWAVDEVAYPEGEQESGVKTVTSRILA
jgi:hypothetical protein